MRKAWIEDKDLVEVIKYVEWQGSIICQNQEVISSQEVFVTIW